MILALSIEQRLYYNMNIRMHQRWEKVRSGETRCQDATCVMQVENQEIKSQNKKCG